MRRSTKVSRPTQRYSPSLHCLLLTDGGEPESCKEALKVDDAVKWELAMKDEMDSLMTNECELTELPKGKKALYNKVGLSGEERARWIQTLQVKIGCKRVLVEKTY